MSEEDRSSTASFDHNIRAFIALQILGGSCLIIILFTAIFHKRVTRYKTWFSFIASWIVSCTSYSVLTFVGQQSQEFPTYGLCLVQGALVYSVPSLTAGTVLGLAIHTFINMRYILSKVTYPLHVLTIYLLVITPWAIWLVMFIISIVWGAQNPQAVRLGKNGTYCHYRDTNFSQLSSLLVVGLNLSTISVEAVICYHLFKQRRMILESGYSMTMTLRVMAFSFCGAVALGLSVAWIVSSTRGQLFEMVLAVLPIAVVLLFGSQADLIDAWTFGKISSYKQLASTRASSTRSISQSSV